MSTDHDAWVAQVFGAHPSASLAIKPTVPAGPAEEVAKPKPADAPVKAPQIFNPNDPKMREVLERAAKRGQDGHLPGGPPDPKDKKKDGDDQGQSPADGARGPGQHVGDDNPLGEGGIDIPLGPVKVRPSTDGTSV